MHILVTSPIPSHPQNHGNRSRVFKLCSALQQLGHSIHFLYAGFEGLTQSQELMMRETWDHVYVLPHKPKKRSVKAGKPLKIDDWYIPEVTMLAHKILARWKISTILANYAWFSEVLNHVPDNIIKYIDTHDQFAGRNEKLLKEGIAPSWFSTTEAEEAKAFARADRIFAIQEQEAETFARYSSVPVEVVGHLVDSHFIDTPQRTETGKLKAGFMASDNAINKRTMATFVEALKQYEAVLTRYDIYIAGAICDCEETSHPAFKKLGFIDNQTDFYRDMDLVLNPNLGGSGLKIKSVEALSYGRPLLATADAMIGMKTENAYHKIQDMEAFCQALIHIGNHPECLAGLNAAGRNEFKLYQETQFATLRRLFPLEGTTP